MSSNEGNLPAKLVLDFTTLYQPCSGNVGTQIQQGNTFSVPFDLSQVTHQGGMWGGLVYVMTDAENNFQAASQIRMAAEGVAGKLAYFSTSQGKATVYGQDEVISKVFILGTPSGDGYTWQAGIVVGGCAVTNGAAGDELAAKLTQES